MTDQDATQNQTGANQPPAAPQVDMAAIAKQVSEVASQEAIKIAKEEAQKMVSSTLKSVAGQLVGESGDESPNKKILEHFVKDPVGFLTVNNEHVEKRTTEKLQEQMMRERAYDRVVTKFTNEYPGLDNPKKIKAAQAYATEHLQAGKTYEEALKAGCEEAVKEFGLKSVKEEQQSFGLPSGGGARGQQSSFNPEKSSADFIQNQRERLNSFRKKQTDQYIIGGNR